jgi:3-methylcrotonyl-CoA carboxylase alpha subunit
MKLKRQGDRREFDVQVLSDDGAGMRLRIGEHEVVAALTAMPDGSAVVTLDGRRLRVAGARRRSAIMIAAGPFAAEFLVVEGRVSRRGGGLVSPEVDAPMPGKVLQVLVKEGQRVEPGEPLIVLEAMKMETTLHAESPALVRKILVAPGQMVDHGARLIELAPVPESARPPESQTPDG